MAPQVSQRSVFNSRKQRTGISYVSNYTSSIPPASLNEVAQEFRTGGGSRGHLSGLGLGLYVSREIVDLHGGTITAEFPADGGTRFEVTLPAYLDPVVAAAAAAPEAGLQVA